MADYQYKRLTIEYLDKNWDYFVKVWDDLWQETSWELAEPEPRGSLEPYIRDLLSHGDSWVCLNGDSIVGISFVVYDYDRHSTSEKEKQFCISTFNKPWVFLDDLAVIPKLRGNGIGKKLMEQMFQDIKEKGFNHFYLYTEASSKSNAFYEKLGFKKLGDILSPKRKNSKTLERRRYYEKVLS